MHYELTDAPADGALAIDAGSPGPRPVGAQVAPLPAGLVYTERSVAMLRAYLEDKGLGHYRVFACDGSEWSDVDELLGRLGEPGAAWEPLPAHSAGGEPLSLLTYSADDRPREHQGGCLRLASFEVVLARWYRFASEGGVRATWLAAAASAGHVRQLRDRLRRHRHAHGAAVWQVIHGGATYSPERVPRDLNAGDALVLAPAVRARVEAEVVRFFDPAVADLYRALGVPHRRGVLLYGPPGNGKTSLIRLIGAALPDVPALILRAAADFDTDDLESVLRYWTEQAPAMLVIEDLNWLLESVNVSTFLNLLDGIDARATAGGLLLVATTNHPQKLDPAVNNRPGRFDVVVEIAAPAKAQRLEFLRQKLPGIDARVIERVAADTEELSFAHLQELLRLSGLLAVYAGRPGRTDDDVLQAAATLRRTFDDAAGGFRTPPETPFGLAAWRKGKESDQD